MNRYRTFEDAGIRYTGAPEWWQYCVFLCHFNGADGATSVTDESDSGHTITFYGDAQLDTAQKKFGTASLLLDGTGDYITIPNSTDFAFGSGDFTIDFWVRFNTLPSNGNVIGFYKRDTCGDEDVILDLKNDSGTYKLRFIIYINSTEYGFIKTWSSPTTDTWYHLAFIRSGDNWYLFVDGTQLGTTDTQSGTIDSASSVISIGRWDSTYPRELNGWLDEFRILKGYAAWTSNFTPPSQEYYSP